LPSTNTCQKLPSTRAYIKIVDGSTELVNNDSRACIEVVDGFTEQVNNDSRAYIEVVDGATELVHEDVAAQHEPGDEADRCLQLFILQVLLARKHQLRHQLVAVQAPAGGRGR